MPATTAGHWLRAVTLLNAGWLARPAARIILILANGRNENLCQKIQGALNGKTPKWQNGKMSLNITMTKEISAVTRPEHHAGQTARLPATRSVLRQAAIHPAGRIAIRPVDQIAIQAAALPATRDAHRHAARVTVTPDGAAHAIATLAIVTRVSAAPLAPVILTVGLVNATLIIKPYNYMKNTLLCIRQERILSFSLVRAVCFPVM
ncbi:hypothetical protein SDC9_95998 [bioreactor metagenome]|uniref:Uncharacterized protein n=1 Tax=bioreactor metagenome TaxID=1076179 RepID=A0A645A7X4_9ZZZZ